MPSILLTIIVICLLSGLLMYGFKPYDYGGTAKRSRKPEKDNDNAGSAPDKRWGSITIQPGTISCRSVAEITNRPFPAQDVPSLPLKDCTQENCRCRYNFLKDRRSGDDRRLEISRFAHMMPGYESERRHVTGRRYADLAV